MSDPEYCGIENIIKLNDFFLRGTVEFVISGSIEAHNFLRAVGTYLSFVCKNLVGGVADPIEVRDKELKKLILRFKNIEERKGNNLYFLNMFESILKAGRKTTESDKLDT